MYMTTRYTAELHIMMYIGHIFTGTFNIFLSSRHQLDTPYRVESSHTVAPLDIKSKM